jgi:Zn-dependent protease/CBS domain-containing protein
MRWSVSIGEFRGIRVYIHWTFLLLLVWIAFGSYKLGGDTEQLIVSLGYILALFTCVVLHEFGHALTAKRFGIKTRDITLFPIGGMARMEKMPESPMQELAVAVAGPLVNVVIAAGLLLYMHISPEVYHIGLAKGLIAKQQVIPTLFLVNLIMAAFNLIPAFPMDGGRIFRALLALRLERAKATQVAASVGQFIAIGFVLLGLFFNIWLVFIGIFIYLSAGAEASQEYMKRDLAHYNLGHVIMHKFTLLRAEDTLSIALHALLDSQEREFVVTENNQVAGVLTRDLMLAGVAKFGQNAHIGSIMRRDIRILSPQLPLTEAMQIMTEMKIPILPVGYPGQVLGVVDLENITEFLLIQKAIH